MKVREDWSATAANTWVGMGRGLATGLVALLFLAACSSGGSSAAKTTTTSTTTSTTVATTTTAPPEDAVKQAYLDYWKILDRLGAAPDPDDPALAARAVDPVLSSVRADLSTRKAQGLTIQLPSGSKYAHVIRGTVVNGNSATVSDCFVDDRIQVAADGTVVNDHVSTAAAMATLIATGSDWKVSSVQIQKTGDGDLGCAG